MGFKKVRIKKRTYTKRKKKSNLLRNIVIFLTAGLFAIGFIGLALVYISYIKPLPHISTLEDLSISESSIIYDRDGNELYTLSGNERRTYINYDNISQNMINAIVSGEDKTFFENPGFDIKGLFRAVFNYITGKRATIEGTSTISQQLIRNVFLTNERSYERKIKEMYLSYQMTKNYTKEKILELYLNKISFGSNAFGIEQASLTFFGKNSKDIDILEASILASLPKGPTYYSPYNYYTRLVGNLYVYPEEDETNIYNLIKPSEIKEYEELVSKFKDFINGLEARRIGNGVIICNLDKNNFKININIDRDSCSVMNYSRLLGFLNGIKIKNETHFIEYEIGRKDFILGRMFEDEHIDFEEYKENLLAGIGYEFKPYRENIKHPHFVFYVREYLENKYGKDLLEEGGLKIYTTLSASLQAEAEKIVREQTEKNIKNINANNAGLISIDNKTGEILSMVGSANYFDESIDGNVNIITSKRQPGSSFKSFVYALAIDKNEIGTQTPIYDLPTTFPGDYEPGNFGGTFAGKMNIMTALNHSKNIPAVKSYFLAGEQLEIIDFMRDLGVNSLNRNFYYGAPLALGTGEMTPLELATAYSVFANMGNRVEITPVLKILDSRGVVIEEKKTSYGVKVMDEITAYIMNYILSDSQTKPNDFWRNLLLLNDRQASAKTGTSNKVFVKNGVRQILPGDLWTAGYTPQITTVVWAGNTDGRAIDRKGTGLENAAPMWKTFMEFAHKDLEKLTWKKPDTLNFTPVSKITGLLPPEGFDNNFIVNSLFKNTPTLYDTSLKPVRVDLYCNGKVGVDAPAGAIKEGYYIAFSAIDSTKTEWQKSIDEWVKEGGAQKEFTNVGNIITNYKDEYCVRPENLLKNASIDLNSNISDGETFSIGQNYVEISYNSNNPLRSIQVLIGGKLIQEINIENLKVGTYKGTINIPNGYSGSQGLTLRAVDSVFYTTEENKIIRIVSRDNTPPKIIITNPDKDFISIYEDQFINLRGYIQERSNIRSINIYINNESYAIGLTGRDFLVELNKDKKIPVGIHTIKVESFDTNFNKGEASFQLEVMRR